MAQYWHPAADARRPEGERSNATRACKPKYIILLQRSLHPGTVLGECRLVSILVDVFAEPGARLDSVFSRTWLRSSKRFQGDLFPSPERHETDHFYTRKTDIAAAVVFVCNERFNWVETEAAVVRSPQVRSISLEPGGLHCHRRCATNLHSHSRQPPLLKSDRLQRRFAML
jgi:hypothetical protein